MRVGATIGFRVRACARIMVRVRIVSALTLIRKTAVPVPLFQPQASAPPVTGRVRVADRITVGVRVRDATTIILQHG